MTLAAVGEFPSALLADLSRRTGLPVAPGGIDPATAWSPLRQQYESTRLIVALRERHPGRVIAATHLDLFIPVLTFVFGEAELGGRAAIFSIHRLRQEYYGLPPDPQLLIERALRELWHEVGHLFGLVHCQDAACVMSPSHSVDQVDTKQEGYCTQCRDLLIAWRAPFAAVPGPLHSTRRP